MELNLSGASSTDKRPHFINFDDLNVSWTRGSAMLLDAIFGVLTVICWPGVVSAALIGGLFYMFGGLKLAALGIVIGAFAGAWTVASRDTTNNSVGAETISTALGAVATVAVIGLAFAFMPLALAIVVLTLIASAFI
jgi:hypothetical protein